MLFLHGSQDGQCKKGILFMESPKLYFAVVNGLMMMIAFYVAVWVTNFDISADYTADSDLWRVRHGWINIL